MVTKKDEKFEVSLEKLESLAQKLEEGDLSLDESLKTFEEGMNLVKSCEEKLSQAQKKIQILMKDASGKTIEKDFGIEDGE